MLKSDVRAALRNIFRNRIPSLISIIGLGIGLGCIIVLMALIIHEKSFDTYIPDHNNVYRIIFGSTSQTQFPLSETMAAEFPEVKDYFRYYQPISIQVKAKGNEIVKESNFGFADASVFRMMGIKFISGEPAVSLSEVAISEESATKYFGNLSPIGSVLPVKFQNGFTELTVSGVYKNFPSNSTLHPSCIANIKLSEKLFKQFQSTLGDFGNENARSFDWSYSEFMSYLVLDKNADPAAMAEKMEKYKEFINNKDKDKLHYKLQPVADIYLGSRDISGNHLIRQGNPQELIYYEIISFMILLISIANFVLLTRSGVSERTLEIGTRKVFGASPGKIRRMVIIEACIVVILSLIPSVFMIEYGMDFINATLNKTLTAQVFLNPLLWLLLISVVVFTGILSGWIIGFYYSGIPALKLISGRILKSGKPNRLNYSFLLIHFTIYMILVSGVIVVSKQIKYSMSEYRGINIENVLLSELTSDNLKKSFSALCEEMKRIPGVVAVAGGTFIPPLGYSVPINLATAEGASFRFDGLIMGEGMTELLGIEVIDGSSFGPYKSGTVEVVVNESTAREHKVKAGDNLLVFKVRGIVKDFHAHSLHNLIQPMVILQQNPARMGLIAIKTSGLNDGVVKDRLEDLFNQISPDEIFEAQYLTEWMEDLYSREKNQAKIIGAFAMLATILSIMGLFGISLISISRRSKEIGLRKVNGASIWEVLFMVNTDFLRWVLASALISVPASVYLLKLWLERFAYKTELNWWIFAIAGISSIVIAILTVSWQSYNAASSNPVEALRHE